MNRSGLVAAGGLVLALICAAAAILAGLGSRWNWWQFRTGFQILTWAAYGGLAAAVLSAGGMVMALLSARRRALLPIPSPCLDRSGGAPALRDGAGLHIGFMGRIAVEKGIEHLIRAFRSIDDPAARLLIAGDDRTVAGGSNIADAVASLNFLFGGGSPPALGDGCAPVPGDCASNCP